MIIKNNPEKTQILREIWKGRFLSLSYNLRKLKYWRKSKLRQNTSLRGILFCTNHTRRRRLLLHKVAEATAFFLLVTVPFIAALRLLHSIFAN